MATYLSAYLITNPCLSIFPVIFSPVICISPIVTPFMNLSIVLKFSIKSLPSCSSVTKNSLNDFGSASSSFFGLLNKSAPNFPNILSWPCVSILCTALDIWKFCKFLTIILALKLSPCALYSVIDSSTNSAIAWFSAVSGVCSPLLVFFCTASTLLSLVSIIGLPYTVSVYLVTLPIDVLTTSGLIPLLSR